MFTSVMQFDTDNGGNVNTEDAKKRKYNQIPVALFARWKVTFDLYTFKRIQMYSSDVVDPLSVDSMRDKYSPQSKTGRMNF
jgi:hypothetical protein